MNTITMDTVRDLIERHSDHISGNTREFYNGAYAEIADELNSRADYHGFEQAAIEAWESVKAWNSRAERTCEFKPFRGPISDTDEEGDRKGVCSECSAYMHEQFNYCPNCGCKVVDE